MSRQMSDSAYPMTSPPPGGWRDIILIYAGGDTVHPWTPGEIASMPSRYRWPCFVRSNPSQVSATADANWMINWLRAHNVPHGTCVILDLEIAVDAAYVNTFNAALRAAGYKVTKYGSQNYIWQNPRTDGGTFVALPGGNVLTTEGDTVARQYGFEGGYDLSIALDQGVLPLWDTHPPAAPYHKHLTVAGDTLGKLAGSRGQSPEQFVAFQRVLGTKIHPLVSGALPAGVEWQSVAP
jgi:hypothetical protein